MLECWKEKEQEKKRRRIVKLAHRLQWLMASMGPESSHGAEKSASQSPCPVSPHRLQEPHEGSMSLPGLRAT